MFKDEYDKDNNHELDDSSEECKFVRAVGKYGVTGCVDVVGSQVVDWSVTWKVDKVGSGGATRQSGPPWRSGGQGQILLEIDPILVQCQISSWLIK